jgi:hypothetical protein
MDRGGTMTQRITALLDAAVSDLEPQAADPVSAVIRRGRAARRRAVVAGAVAVVAALTGGIVVNDQLVGRDARPVVAEQPPIPRLVNGNVVAGGLILPVPKGWRVVAAGSAPCGRLTDTILIGGPDDAGCAWAPITVAGTWHTSPGGLVTAFDPLTGGLTVSTPRQITLRGGEPAWLDWDTIAERLQPRPDAHAEFNRLLLPWSKVSIMLRVDGPAQQRIIDSIRTSPAPASRLVLPAAAGLAELTTPDAPREYASITDPATIAQVLGLMGEHTTTVDRGRACSTQAHPTARLTFRASERRSLRLPPPVNPERVTATFDVTTIIITLADDCYEAVSSRGGRVRLTKPTVDELRRLFGKPIR